MQGFLRPGCVHLLLDVALHGRGRRASDLNPALFASALGAWVLEEHDVTVQFDDGRLTLFRAADNAEREYGEGTTGSADDTDTDTLPAAMREATAVKLPRLLCVTPAAAAGAGGTVELYAAGLGLVQPGARVLLRTQGGYLPVTCEPAAKGDPRAGKMLAQAAAVCPDAAASVDVIRVTARSVPGPGLALLEVQAPGHSHLLSNWLPVALAGCEGEVEELLQLLRQPLPRPALPPPSSFTTGPLPLLLDYGRLVDFVHSVRFYQHNGACGVAPLCVDSASQLLSDMNASSSEAVTPVRTRAELERLLAMALRLRVYLEGNASVMAAGGKTSPLPLITGRVEKAVWALEHALLEYGAVGTVVPNGSAYRLFFDNVDTPASPSWLADVLAQQQQSEEEEEDNEVDKEARGTAEAEEREAEGKVLHLLPLDDTPTLVPGNFFFDSVSSLADLPTGTTSAAGLVDVAELFDLAFHLDLAVQVDPSACQRSEPKTGRAPRLKHGRGGRGQSEPCSLEMGCVTDSAPHSWCC